MTCAGMCGWDGRRVCELQVYSLTSGRLVQSLGGPGKQKGRFRFEAGGVCVSSRGTVLVAERYNDRVQVRGQR